MALQQKSAFGVRAKASNASSHRGRLSVACSGELGIVLPCHLVAAAAGLQTVRWNRSGEADAPEAVGVCASCSPAPFLAEHRRRWCRRDCSQPDV